jgi:hypothetical protein
MLDPAVGVRIGLDGLAIAAESKSVCRGAAQHAEVVVVGVVLHHQHHDVLDLGNHVRAFRHLRVGSVTWLARDQLVDSLVTLFALRS